eukprot:TRINITY_DN21780_c0_g1_i1.p1 TRINITY_DN21780_c0_g1~~TRINITY_DN21780_c0_g1_i1.p1  ORF type:complete len:331 (+),score=61.79 TRINITY_DN21780_c0_g1_i1:935-1927(+)
MLLLSGLPDDLFFLTMNITTSSSSSLDLLPDNLDMFSVKSLVFLCFSFILVQAHLLTMPKYDCNSIPSNLHRRSSWAIRVLIALSILVEFVDLVPVGMVLFFNDTAHSLLKIELIFIAHACVTTFCYLISIVKVVIIAKRMVRQARIDTDYTYHILGSLCLLLLSYFGALEIGVSFYVLGFIGFLMHLLLLNKLRQADAPAVINRMFWAFISSLFVTIGFAIVLIGILVKAFNDNNVASAQTQEELATAEKAALKEIISTVITVSVLYGMIEKGLNVLSTGYWVGDIWWPQQDQLDLSEHTAAEHEETAGLIRTSGAVVTADQYNSCLSN